nr:RNA-directed DNA polymerase, eukaryota [Tanacetum cinerariifolium]
MSNEKEDNKGGMNDKQSDDPFNIYELLNKTQDNSNGEDTECNRKCHEKEKEAIEKKKVSKTNLKENVEESVCSGHLKSVDIPRSGGSILQVMDDLIKISNEENAMIKMNKKLKIFKQKIKVGSEKKRRHKDHLKSELVTIDHALDQRDNDVDLVAKRITFMKSLHVTERLENIELVQKAKVKWVIEGDENSRYFHGIILKERSQLAIRGVLVDGVWINDPIEFRKGGNSSFIALIPKT